MDTIRTTIDDGLDEPIKDTIGRNQNGSSESTLGTVKSERATSVAANDGIPTISPFDIPNAGTDANPSEPRRRGRPRGSRNASIPTTAQKTTGDLKSSIEHVLLTLTKSTAALLKVPELEIDPSEAKDIQDSFKELCKYYPIALSPKKLAIFDFAAVVGTVVGSRAMAIHERHKREAQTRPQKVVNQPVVQIDSKSPVVATAERRVESPSQIWNEAPDDNQHDVS